MKIHYALNQIRTIIFSIFLLFVFSNISSQTICRPISETHSQGGLICVGMSVTNPTNAFDVDSGLTTYASLVNSVGVGCFVEETMTFGQTAKAGDAIVIYFGTGATVVDLGLLANATVQAKNGATNVGAALALNNPLLNLELLPGGTIASVRLVLSADANAVQVQVGGLLSLLVNLRVYDVRLELAAPTVTGGATKNICSGQSVSLAAVPTLGTTLAWYSSATSTTPLATGNTYTTPNLTATTTYYIGVTRAAGCESAVRIPVVVNVANPVAPTISTTGTLLCSANPTVSTTLNIQTPVPGTVYNWYNVATGGTPLATGNSYSPTVPVGVTSYYVEAVIGTCISPTRTRVDVTLSAIPGLPTLLTQSATIQSGQNTTLQATTSEAGVVLDWYDVPTGGTALLKGSNSFTTPILTTTKTYYVEARSTVGDCVSPTRVSVTVTVQGSAAGNCLQANSQQTSQNGLCLLCGITNPGNAVDGDDNTASALAVPLGLVNGWIQQTLQFDNVGRAGDTITVQLGQSGIIDIGALSNISLATYNGATFNNDRVTINNLTDIEIIGSRFTAKIAAGAIFDRIEIRLGGVASVLAQLDIYGASYKFVEPVISGATIICAGMTSTLTATTTVGATIRWYDAATGGTLLNTGGSYTTPVLTANTTYYVEVSRGTCVNSERLPVLVTVNNPVAPTIDPLGTTVCSGRTTTLNITTPVVGTTYNWYDASIGGTLLATGTSYITPALTIATNYYVEAVIGNCISPTRIPVAITVNNAPVAPTVTTQNVTIQSGQSVILQASAPPTGVVLDWYAVAVGGIPLVSGANTFTTPNLTVNTTYYVEARDTGTSCMSLVRTPVQVLIGAPVSSCLAAASQTSGSGGICVLCSIADAANAVDSDDNTASTLNVPIGILNAYFQQTLVFNNAGKVNDTINVKLGIPSGLNISLLSNIILRTYNGAVDNNDPIAINSTLLKTQLLSDNRFIASFVATKPFDRIEIRFNSGVVGLVSVLNIYGASYKYAKPTVTGAGITLCEGTSTTLVAATVPGDAVRWYDAAVGGNLLDSDESFTTPNLTATTIYYLAIVRGTCEDTSRLPVKVNVNAFPVASDIIISSPLTASCVGGIVLSPTTAIEGGVFKYYTDQTKTTEITTGFAGHPGVTYTKDATTGALTISGLNSNDSPYTYYISLANGACESLMNTLKEVVVNYPVRTVLDVTTPLEVCGTAKLGDAIVGYDFSGDTVYRFYDASNNPITLAAANAIQTSGTYFIEAKKTADACPSERKPVVVTINPLPSLNITNPTVETNIGTSVTLQATSSGTIIWYDAAGTALPSNIAGPFATAGSFTFTAVASNANCSVNGTVTVKVTDPANACPDLTERVYANTQSWSTTITGSVTDEALAVDGDPQTASTINSGIGLLGIGTTSQRLQWTTTITAGTPVTVKLGSGADILALGSTISVVGTKRDGLGNPVDIGTLQSVSGGELLDLLSGDNSFEYTFVPSDGTGPKAYDGVRISVQALIGVAQTAKVYEAYYNKSVSSVVCTPGDIEDILYGAVDLGVGAATTTVGVTDPWNAVDSDLATYATMYTGAGILAAAEMEVVFKTPTTSNDTLRIAISKPGTLLELNVLVGLMIQPLSGTTPVGPPIDNASPLLRIGTNDGAIELRLVSPLPQSYDRVRLRLGGVAGVLDNLRIHAVDRVTNTKVIGADPTNTVTVCPGATLQLEVPAQPCATFVWYDSKTGGNKISDQPTYTVPSTLAPGTYKYYVQPVRYDCETLSRGEVTVIVRPMSPVAAITDILVNSGNETSLCSEDGTATLQATLNSGVTLTNPVFHWYKLNGTTVDPVPGETTATLALTGLVPGTYTYYVGVNSDEYCETVEADRKTVTFTILPFSMPTDINVNNVEVCYGVTAVLTPTTTLTDPVFTWYFDNNKTQPIPNGTVSGITYTIDNATGELSALGFPVSGQSNLLFVAISSATTCANEPGQLKQVTITAAAEVLPPTTSDTTQDFCLDNNPTVADIQVTGTGVIWYDAATGGTVVPDSTPLVNGTTYYAVSKVASCESINRLAIMVTVDTPGTPTTTDDTPEFCLADHPTVADIQVTGTGIIWYNAATGGTVVPGTTALLDGTVYYAVSTIADCESVNRLAVTVTVADPATPTTVDNTPEFCLAIHPTVADLQVTSPVPGASVVWYDAATGGNVVPGTTALVNGKIYYAVSQLANGCESATRLVVTVTVYNPVTPTTSNHNQRFCLTDNATVADIQVTGTGIVWYDAATGGAQVPGNTALITGTTYYAASAIAGCESVTRLAVAVTIGACSDIRISKTVDNPNPFVDHNVTFTIQIDNIGKDTFNNVTVEDLLPSGYQFISATTSNGTYNHISGLWDIPVLNNQSSETLQVVAKVLSSGNYLNIARVDISTPLDSDLSNNQAQASAIPQCLLVYNEFTPNGDGANDYFRIECIENYPNNTLLIYNRYGQLVFETRGYRNDWTGIANKNTPISANSELPAGVYYYILDTGSDQGVKKGWLYLIR